MRIVIGFAIAAVVGFLVLESATTRYKLMVDGGHVDTFANVQMCKQAAPTDIPYRCEPK